MKQLRDYANEWLEVVMTETMSFTAAIRALEEKALYERTFIQYLATNAKVARLYSQ